MMIDKTKEFIDNIDILSKKEELVDDNFYTINLCQKLIDLYLSKNDYSIKKTFECFHEIYKVKHFEELEVLRIMSGLCIYVLKLRLAKTINDEKLKKVSVENIKKFVNILDSIL